MTRGPRHKMNADAFDWVYGRHWYNWRPGVGKAIKKSLNRQTRYRGRLEASQALQEASWGLTPLEPPVGPPGASEGLL